MVLGLPSCGLFEPHCDMAKTSADLAGEDAVDCGHTVAPENPDWDCVTDAFVAGTPFTVGYQVTGMDSRIEIAYAFDGARMWVLSQDDYGGSTKIDGQECVGPVPSDTGGFDCMERLPEGNHYQVCGTICGPNACQPQPLPFPG